MPIVDKTGQKFGHLTVLRKSEKRRSEDCSAFQQTSQSSHRGGRENLWQGDVP